jgi:hypothetical protein
MLIAQSTFTWAWASSLAVAVPCAIYLKLTGWVRFRRGEHEVGFKRLGGAFAISVTMALVFLNFEHRGNTVWIYKESGGRLIGEEFILFGHATVPIRDSKLLEVEEAPRVSDANTNYILNDAGRPLKVPVGYPAGRQLTLESGLLLKTTDYFFGDAEFAK